MKNKGNKVAHKDNKKSPNNKLKGMKDCDLNVYAPNLGVYIHCSTIHNSQDMETT